MVAAFSFYIQARTDLEVSGPNKGPMDQWTKFLRVLPILAFVACEAATVQNMSPEDRLT